MFLGVAGRICGGVTVPAIIDNARPQLSPAIWTDGLTAKEAAFVEHYVAHRNATQAYDHAYDARGGSYDNRRNEGHRVLNRPDVAKAIAVRQQAATAASGIDTAWLLQYFLRIATADARELIGLKIGCCRYCYGEGHGYQWRQREYVEACDQVDRENDQLRLLRKPPTVPYPDPAGGFDFNATFPPVGDCPQCHGEGLERFVPRDTDKLSDQALALYGGVKVKKDGYEIIIADRSKAAELAGRILGAFNDKVRISGAIGAMHAIADLRTMDPQEASKAYRDFVAGHLAA